MDSTLADTTPVVIRPAVVAAAQAGDRAAFDEILTCYQARIYGYVYLVMGSAEDAYDLTQDTFLKAWLGLPKTTADLRVGSRIGGWLYRIATNVCLDELRHRKLVQWRPWEAFISVFHPSQIDRAPGPEEITEAGELEAEVRRVLSGLSPLHRACLVLREYEHLEYAEIAAALSTTRFAVRSALWRARNEFAALWRRAGHDAPAERYVRKGARS